MERRRIVFSGHPYSNEPQGTVESITRIKTADLAAYHRRMMQTSRLLLVVVGDVDPAELQKRIAASFGSLPRGDYKPAPLPSLFLRSRPSMSRLGRCRQTTSKGSLRPRRSPTPTITLCASRYRSFSRPSFRRSEYAESVLRPRRRAGRSCR